MIDAANLASRDIGSASDPYLSMTIGRKKYTERENYQLDEENPDFFKSYDFESEFPGCPPLNIDVMDYDDLFGDDLIGSTQVDLEDRYFNHEWAALKDKPIETRQLYHPSMGASQGLVRMWVEIAKA
jgi:Ca2+-dependent lipid-binding protein